MGVIGEEQDIDRIIYEWNDRIGHESGKSRYKEEYNGAILKTHIKVCRYLYFRRSKITLNLISQTY